MSIRDQYELNLIYWISMLRVWDRLETQTWENSESPFRNSTLIQGVKSDKYSQFCEKNKIIKLPAKKLNIKFFQFINYHIMAKHSLKLCLSVTRSLTVHLSHIQYFMGHGDLFCPSLLSSTHQDEKRGSLGLKEGGEARDQVIQ